MVGGTRPDTSVDGVQNTTSVGSAHSTSVGDAHNLNSVGDARRCPVSKANMASETENGGASGPYTSVSPFQMLGTKRPTNATSYVPNQLPNPKKKVGLNRKGANSAPVTSPITNQQAPPKVLLLCRSGGGLRASAIPDAMPAGVSTPGRFNHAGQALAKRPD